MRLIGSVASLLFAVIIGCFAAGTAQAIPGEPTIDPFALTRIERGFVLNKKTVRYGLMGALAGAVVGVAVGQINQKQSDQAPVLLVSTLACAGLGWHIGVSMASSRVTEFEDQHARPTPIAVGVRMSF